MFVLNDNEQDILFITIDYCSVLQISFIFYMNGIILTYWDETERK